MKKITKPDYTKWFRNDAIIREEAALLMAGVEPNSDWGREILDGYNGKSAKELEKYYDSDKEIKNAYDTFYEIDHRLFRSIQAGQLAWPHTTGHRGDSYIKIVPLLTYALREVDSCVDFKEALKFWWEERSQPKQIAPKPEKSLLTRERETVLRIIIGMAVEQYGYDGKAKKNSATSQIADDLKLHGVPVDEDTIRKWLKEGWDILPQEAKDKTA